MRQILGGVLLAASLAQAQPGDAGVPVVRDVDELSLEALLDTPVAIATKGARDVRETPGVVTAVTREEILASGARDLLEVLQLIPGFSFHVDVVGVVGVGFRGMWGHEGKLLLLIDGIEMNELLYQNTE